MLAPIMRYLLHVKSFITPNKDVLFSWPFVGMFAHGIMQIVLVGSFSKQKKKNKKKNSEDGSCLNLDPTKF